MVARPLNSAIDHLRRSVQGGGTDLGDGELLGRFIERRDDDAVAALVTRHGPMVWGVCRRLLGHHDAADAFQAAFLVLVRKAASIVPREMVGNWLHGVAYQTALQARRAAARRIAREVQVMVMPDPEPVNENAWPEVQPLLDQELSRLPEIYRAVIILCDLEGQTRKDVARQLRVPEGTVAGRLARARALLAKRLTQRGVILSSGALAAVLTRNVASAVAPTWVVSRTIQVASVIVAGQAAPAGLVSAKVAALSERVLKAMMISKLKAVTAIAVVLGLIGTGTTVSVSRMAAVRAGQPPAAERPAPAAPKGEKLQAGVEAKLKWGEPLKGLRAAVAIRPVPGAKAGDKPDLYLVVQNASKAHLRFTSATEATEPGRLYWRGDGVIKWALTFKWPTPIEVLLQPGEAIFVPLFPLKPTDGPPMGATIADDLLKLPRYSLVVHMDIQKPPAGTWAGNLVSGETSGAAAEIKADPPAAGEKK